MKNRTIPFGYRYTDGAVTIDDVELLTLHRICDEYLSGRSLLQIADGLSADEIEFAPGITFWDKSKIKRIIDDDRYLGNDTYPQIISSERLAKMRLQKYTRNTQTKTNRKTGIYLLRIPVICSDCGSLMHRRQDMRAECTQKWICDQCGFHAPVDDSTLLTEITELLNQVIREPEKIQTVQISEYEPSVEERKLNNEIARTFEGTDFDKNTLCEKIFLRAVLRYKKISDKPFIEKTLRELLGSHEILHGFDPELTKKAIKEIRLTKTGSISIVLVNDQILQKEQTENAGRGRANHGF